MQQINWTSRTFDFNFSAELFPVIVTRLEGSYPRIKYLTENVSSQRLTTHVNGKWSVQQHIGHLIDLEELHSKRIIDFRNGAKILTAWDGTNAKTELANHDAKNISDLLQEFENVRNHFIKELLQFQDDDITKSSIHPRLLKPMRVIDMAFFVAEHDDHHIAKMLSILHDK